MKITSFELFEVKAGWRPWFFLKVVTDEGIVGWSDCTDAHGSNAGVAASIRELGESLIGRDPMPLELVFQDLYRITRQSSGGVVQKAIAAIENALLDIKAKALGVPVCVLLGGPVRERVRLYWSHCGSTRIRHHSLLGAGARPVRSLADIEILAHEVRERGFSGAKTNLILFPEGRDPLIIGQGFGGGEGSYDRNLSGETLTGIRRLMEIFRKGLGPDADLILDANMHFRADGMVRMARALSEYGLAWLEVDMDDPAQLRALRGRAPMPIGSCEKRQLMSGYKPFLDAGAMDVAIIDVRWTGVWQAKKIADLAACYDVNIAPHNHGSPLATLMAAHFCAAATNLRIMEYDVDDVPWRDSLLTEPMRIEQGHLLMPDAPGWGADVDESALRARTA
ncbi:MAG: mandelate racemase/muconate lactonizing enzyme family protein [Candidatus Binatia bacterium]